MSIVSAGRYFEDYELGTVGAHRRGHSVSVSDNQGLSLATMNTASTHFNEESLRDYFGGAFEAPLLNACVAVAIVVGLTTEDMSENAVFDVSWRGIRMPHPVFTGDTLYAASTVTALEEAPGREDLGLLTYAIAGRSHDRAVLEMTRTVALKRRHPWAARDLSFERERIGISSATPPEQEGTS